MSEYNLDEPLDALVQMVELAKKAGVEEIPIKTDAVLQFVEGFKELESVYDEDMQNARHEGWLRGVRDMAQNALSRSPKIPVSPFKSDDN